jgi:hypothetical protein
VARVVGAVSLPGELLLHPVHSPLIRSVVAASVNKNKDIAYCMYDKTLLRIVQDPGRAGPVISHGLRPNLYFSITKRGENFN